MLPIILIVLAILVVVLVGGFFIVSSSVPEEFHTEYEKTVSGSPEALFHYVNDLESWPQWSYWDQLDPDMKSEYSDPAVGEGEGIKQHARRGVITAERPRPRQNGRHDREDDDDPDQNRNVAEDLDIDRHQL